MVALWLFVSDRDVLSLQRYEHGEDVVEGKLLVIPGTLNARAIILAHFSRTGRQRPVCSVHSRNSRGGAHSSGHLAFIAL